MRVKSVPRVIRPITNVFEDNGKDWRETLAEGHAEEDVVESNMENVEVVRRKSRDDEEKELCLAQQLGIQEVLKEDDVVSAVGKAPLCDEDEEMHEAGAKADVGEEKVHSEEYGPVLKMFEGVNERAPTVTKDIFQGDELNLIDRIFSREQLQFTQMLQVGNDKRRFEDSTKERHCCNYCDKTFSRAWNKLRHEWSHGTERTYKCRFCENTFSSSTDWKRHELVHTGLKPYKCSYCEKTFSRNHNRVIHELVHTGLKPYKCSYCEKTFSRNHNRVIHERVHTGEKPYKCSFCEKLFPRNSSKNAHERIHTGEKPYNCNYCLQAFSDIDNAKRHERTHAETYYHSFCLQSVYEKNQMAKYERAHSQGNL